MSARGIQGSGISARCFALHRGGRWVAVCRLGLDEHYTIEGYATRAEAVQAAREVAARLVAVRKIAAPEPQEVTQNPN